MIGVNHKCPACGIVWSCLGCFEREPRCSDCTAKPVAAVSAKDAIEARNAEIDAAETRDEHAALRLRFALALCADFSAIAATIGRALPRDRELDMTYDSPIVHLFGLADAFATEHERRCAEEAKVSR